MAETKLLCMWSFRFSRGFVISFFKVPVTLFSQALASGHVLLLTGVAAAMWLPKHNPHLSHLRVACTMYLYMYPPVCWTLLMLHHRGQCLPFRSILRLSLTNVNKEFLILEGFWSLSPCFSCHFFKKNGLQTAEICSLMHDAVWRSYLLRAVLF